MEMKFEDVVYFQEGPGVRNWQFRDNGIKLINIRNLINDNLVLSNTNNYLSVDEIECKYKHFLLKEGDYVMASSGVTWGKIAEVHKEHLPLCLNTSIIRLVSKDTSVLAKRYLFYFIKSNLFCRQIEKIITGSAQPNFGPSHLKQININVISIEEQIKYVNMLDTSQSLIDKRKQQIEACDKLMKSKFIEMFGDPVENPMGWKVEQLKKLSTKIMSGNTPKGGNQVYVEDGIMFFRSQNVWKNKLELDDIAYIDEETHKQMEKSSLQNRDILMTKTGRINTENSSLGRAAMYLGEDDCANINGHVYLIRLKKNIINEFVLFILTTDEYREHIRRVCVGGIDKRQLNKEHIEEFPIILPPAEQQNEFVNLLKQVDSLKFKLLRSLSEMEDNFNVLMQKAFKGELLPED